MTSSTATRLFLSPFLPLSPSRSLFPIIFILVFDFSTWNIFCTSHGVAYRRDARPEQTLDGPPQVAFEENQSQVPRNGLEWQVAMVDRERGSSRSGRGSPIRGELSILCAKSCDAFFKRRFSHAARRRDVLPFNILCLSLSLSRFEKESVAKENIYIARTSILVWILLNRFSSLTIFKLQTKSSLK